MGSGRLCDALRCVDVILTPCYKPGHMFIAEGGTKLSWFNLCVCLFVFLTFKPLNKTFRLDAHCVL